MTKKHQVLVGYARPSEVINRLFTLSTSLVLLILAIPFFVIVPILIKVQDGGPVFYAGLRLGRGKKPFRMFKFRTLGVDAQDALGTELFSVQFSSNRHLLTKTGKFLRETRIDEIPQLLNTLKGDMDLLGPRPVRPEIYEKFCKDIKGYDKRFVVKPGLIGYSQLFTPHSSPKKIRNLLDNRFIYLKHRYSHEIVILTYAFFVLSFRLAATSARYLLTAFRHAVGGKKEYRALDREPLRDVFLHTSGTGNPAGRALIKDINYEAISAYSNDSFGDGEFTFEIKIPLKRRMGTRTITKTARCKGEIVTKRSIEHNDYRFCYVVRYVPASPFNTYLVHQYLLHGSIAGSNMAWRLTG